MKTLFILVLAIFSLNGYAQISSTERTKIDEEFKQWNNSFSPGAALGIVKNGKLVYAKGYGMADLEHNIPITGHNDILYRFSLKAICDHVHFAFGGTG
jgi:CubicO group peptidase (beta-lactamase class C family)